MKSRMRRMNRTNKYRQRLTTRGGRRRRNLRLVSTRKNKAMRRVKNKNSRSRLVVMKHRGGVENSMSTTSMTDKWIKFLTNHNPSLYDQSYVQNIQYRPLHFELPGNFVIKDDDYFIQLFNDFLKNTPIDLRNPRFLETVLSKEQIKIICESEVFVTDEDEPQNRRPFSPFDDCEIKEIQIPNNVIRLANNLFECCYSSLEKVTFEEGSLLKEIGNETFKGCLKLQNVDLAKCSHLEKIDASAFQNSTLRTVIIPRKLQSIGGNAFARCSLTHIYFEGGSLLNEIGTNAFSSSKLHDVELPLYVTSIGKGAFFKCSKLTKVTFPNAIVTLTTLEDSVFSQCKNLEEFQIPSSVKSIGKSTFEKSGLRQITFPENIESIGEKAFDKCPLTNITFHGAPRYENIKQAFTNITTVSQITCDNKQLVESLKDYNNWTSANSDTVLSAA